MNPFADSGLESFVLTRLRWLDVRIVPQAWLEGHRVDFLIGDRLVLQIDGGHHVDAQRIADNEHDAELMLRGFHVIRVGYRQVVDDWPAVQMLIMRAVGQGLHRVR
ncbi:endonuclease domain-containing protein [Agromyces sp. NPDC055520]